jgi:hypothetical protein
MTGATPDGPTAFPPAGRCFNPLVLTRSFDAYPVRVLWWAEDRSMEQRFCVSLVAHDEGPDEVLVDEVGRVLAQASLESVRARAHALGHDLVRDRPGPAPVDVFGAAARVTSRPTEDDCAAINDVWSFLTEVSRSTGQSMDFSGEDARRVGDKIFWGTGVLRPASAPPWTPRLTRRDRRKLHQVLDRGTRNLARVIGSTGNARFERVVAAVNTEDPAGLMALGGPYYEYRPEVDDLLRLGADATADDVREVFARWFDDEHHLDHDQCLRLAAVVRQD